MPTLPAPNMKVLLNFEENFEKAALARIEAEGIEAFRARTLDQQPPLFVRTEFTLGQATGAMHVRSGVTPPRKVYSEFIGTLEIQIQGNRQIIGASSTAGIDDMFSETRAWLREIFDEAEWPLNDSNLPYYRVSKLEPAGTQNGVTPDSQDDVSTLRFNVKFAIRPDAWPVAV